LVALVSPSPRFHEAIEKEYDNYEETLEKRPLPEID
jgi:hypothetical protein